jgi:ABC-type transporter Mla maintaining outer membrane lipid asymmetry ATPase subunit MlaF
VLLIDNPLATIEPRQARWWLDFLCEANKSMTLVVAVDDLRAWTDVGKRFAVLREKRLDVIGSREDVKKSSDPLVRELMTHAFTVH